MKRNLLRLVGIGLMVLGTLAAAGTVLVFFILPRSYLSMARVAVQAPPSDPGAVWQQTEFERIHAKLVLYPVITNLNLNHKWAERFHESGPFRTEQSYLLLKQALNVREARHTSIIEIGVWSEDRMEAAQIANEIARVYRALRTGPDGRAAVEITDQATPTLRPGRPSPGRFGVGLGICVLAMILGLVLAIQATHLAR